MRGLERDLAWVPLVALGPDAGFPIFSTASAGALARKLKAQAMSIVNEQTPPAELLDKREVRIRRMFNAIAPSYDLLNHLLSLNIDKYWRWRTTRMAPPDGDAPILDLCTGTGDLALAYDRAADRRVPVVAADFCHAMLVRAGQKVHRRQADQRIRFLEADAQHLPLAD